MKASKTECILVVDTNHAVSDGLQRALCDDGHQVITTSSGDQAFRMLRNRDHAIDWLYSRAALPGLIDGWILADEYQAVHPRRVAIIAAHESRRSGQGHVVIGDPSVWAIHEELRRLVDPRRSFSTMSGVEQYHWQLAA